MILDILNLEKVTVRLQGNEDAYDLYRYFNDRHPKYFIIKRKEVGVALLKIPPNYEDYLSGKERQALRTNRNKSIRAGIYFSEFSPNDYIDDIMEINRSTLDRQGRPMHIDYLDKETVSRYLAKVPLMYGVFLQNGVLCSYANVPMYGEIALISRIIGHEKYLDKGIMYLLISEIIKEIFKSNIDNKVKWLMYDTYYGGGQGLRYFKERCGFKPYRVRWVLANEEEP